MKHIEQSIVVKVSIDTIKTIISTTKTRNLKNGSFVNVQIDGYSWYIINSIRNVHQVIIVKITCNCIGFNGRNKVRRSGSKIKLSISNIKDRNRKRHRGDVGVNDIK